MPIKKSEFDKLETFEGIKAHTRFIHPSLRKIIAVESPDGSVEVRYDQDGKLEGKIYKNMADFEREAYRL